jgi:hypothetical protein
MLQHRQRLPLPLEARDDFARVHAELDDLERDAPPHRLLLLRHPHRAKATLADLLEQLVRPDALARFLGLEPRKFQLHLGRRFRGRERSAGFVVGSEQEIDAGTQLEVVAALAIEERGALLGLRGGDSGQEERLGAGRVVVHWALRSTVRARRNEMLMLCIRVQRPARQRGGRFHGRDR